MGLFRLFDIRYWNTDDLFSIYEYETDQGFNIFRIEYINFLRSYKKDRVLIYDMEELDERA